MATDSKRISHFGRGWRWLNRFGLLMPLAIGVALVVPVTITLPSPRYHSQPAVNAGSPPDYAVGEPVHFKEQRFWLVRLPGAGFGALCARAPATACPLPRGSG